MPNLSKTDGYVRCSPDLLEGIAWSTGETIERDPETERIFLKTDSGWYWAQLGGDAA